MSGYHVANISLNHKYVPFMVSCSVAHADPRREISKKSNSCHPCSRGTLDSTFPVVFRNGFFRDEVGALISL